LKLPTSEAGLGLLPTPRVKGQEGYKTRAKRKGHEVAMSYLESNLEYQTGITGPPNPLFIMEMMGFPTDWTVLPFQGGEQKQIAQEVTL
jgi:hypothetical protein